MAKLKQELATLAKKVDQTFTDNDLVVIENSELVICKRKKSPDKTVLKKLAQLISQRLPIVPILDVLVDTEQWLN